MADQTPFCLPHPETTMTPEQIPTDLAAAVGEWLYDGAHAACEETGCNGIARPEYEEMARALLSDHWELLTAAVQQEARP